MFVRFLLALAGLAASLAVPIKHVLHEKRNVPSDYWQKTDRVAANALIPMRIGLKQSNLEHLYDRLMEVSHPESPNYSNHWSQEDVIAHFAPSNEAVAAVRQWLIDSGIAAHRILQHDNKGWLALDVTGAEAEKLLHTEYHEHEHSFIDGKMAIGCDQYYVPAHIQKHIDYITPGVKHTGVRKRAVSHKRQYKRSATAATAMPGRGSPLRLNSPPHVPMLSKKGDLSNCSLVITPDCIAALYGIPEPNGLAHPNNQMGVFESGDYYSQKDLNLFFANFTPYIPQDTHPALKSVDGGKAPVNVKNAGGESDLDMQLAYPIIYPQKLWVYQVDDINYATDVIPSQGFGNTFLDALDGSYCNYTAFNETGDSNLDPQYPDNLPGGYKGPLQCGVHRPTFVISISYGEQENQLPPGYQERQCNEFGKLGLQGISLFCASGDYGVAGPHRLSHTYGGCIGPNGTAFSPTNPNSCPYLTNVGATQIIADGTVKTPESGAWGYFANNTILFTSSGGFSNIYPIPDYQKSAVKHYFANNEPPFPYYEGGENIGQNGGVYNRIGHGIPDVAANGLYIATFVEGEFGLEAGTSASSPIFAAIISRINEERLEIGKKTVGFINPALYAHPAMLNDIVNGTNPGCNTTGFSAAPGWDPVTGLGTPNYTKMLKYFINLP